jgi:hypothetical protein
MLLPGRSFSYKITVLQESKGLVRLTRLGWMKCLQQFWAQFLALNGDFSPFSLGPTRRLSWTTLFCTQKIKWAFF